MTILTKNLKEILPENTLRVPHTPLAMMTDPDGEKKADVGVCDAIQSPDVRFSLLYLSLNLK